MAPQSIGADLGREREEARVRTERKKAGREGGEERRGQRSDCQRERREGA